jgi:hypothetical protein
MPYILLLTSYRIMHVCRLLSLLLPLPLLLPHQIAASPIPHLLLPAFRRSRSRLLGMFRESLAAGDFQSTVVNQLLQG